MDEEGMITAADGSLVEIPKDFICPITLTIMKQPLCNRAGHSFDRSAILEWLEESGTCPLTRKPMTPSGLIPNRPLEARIRFFLREHGLEEERMMMGGAPHQAEEDFYSAYDYSDARQLDDPADLGLFVTFAAKTQSKKIASESSSSYNSRRGSRRHRLQIRRVGNRLFL